MARGHVTCLDCEFLSVTKNIHFRYVSKTCNDVIAFFNPAEAHGTQFSRNHTHTGSVKLLLHF